MNTAWTKWLGATMTTLALLLAGVAAAANGIWIGPSTGSTPNFGNLWSDSANWSLGTIPGTVGGTTNTDTVFMNTQGHYTIELNANYNVQNLYHNVGPHGHAIATQTGHTLSLTNGGSITGVGGGRIKYFAPVTLEGGAGGAYSFLGERMEIFSPVSGTATVGQNYDLILGGTGLNNLVGTSGIYVGNLADGSGGGTLSVIKTGTGKWTLNNANTYTGTTTVREGALIVNHTSAFGAGTSTVQLGDSSTGALANIELEILGNGTYTRNIVANADNSSGTTTIAVRQNRNPVLAGTITLNRDIEFMNTNSGNLTVSGQITGTGGFTKNGVNNLYLDGTVANDFAGGVTINSGVVYAKNASNTSVLGSGRLTMTGGTFSLHTSDGQSPASQTVGSIAGSGGTIRAGNRTLTFGGDNTDSTFQGNWDGGSFTKTGTGTTTVFIAGSTVSGIQGVNVNAGTLRLGASKNFGTTVNVSGTLDLNGYSTNGDLHLYAGGAVTTGAGMFTSTAAQQYFHNAGTSTFTGNWVLPASPNFRGDINSILVIDGVLGGGAGSITASGNMQGSAIIRLSGSSANTFTGTWAVGAGTTELNKTAGVDAIPTNVSMTGGTLKWLTSNQVADSATLAFGGGSMNLNGFNETAARLVVTGFFTPASGGLLTLGASSGDVISLAMPGVNVSQEVGVDLALTGAGGDISFTAHASQNRIMRLGTGTVGQRTLNLGSAIRTVTVTDGPLAVDALITSQITGTGGIVKAGAGTLQISAANPFSGETRVDAGILNLNHNMGLQNSAFDTSGAGSLVFATGIDTPTFGGLKGSGNLVLPGTMTALTLNPGLAASHDFTGDLSGGSASLQLTMTGAGIQILSGSNTYGGATNLNAGILQANHASALGTGGNIVFGGGTLQYSAASAGQDWAARFKNSASSISLDTNGQTVTLGAIDGTNSGGLSKLGGGTLVLAGTNTYTGPTTVEAGTLLINGSTAAASPVVVNGGTLGGSGFVGGTVTVNAGGTLAPGSSIESLGSGDLSLTDGSTFEYELNSVSLAGDLVYVTGTVILTGEVTLTLDELASGKLAAGTKLTLISSTEAWNGGLFTYQGSLLADDSIFTLGSNKWLFDYNDTVGGDNFAADQLGAINFITMTTIPEPTAGLLLALGGLVALRRRR